MPKIVSDELQQAIFDRLCLNEKLSNIASSLNVSLSTVKRYKRAYKDSIAIRQRMYDTDICDNTKLLTDSEKRYADRFIKELNLYEDIEEGWIFHLSKSDLRVKQSGMWWSCIVYPESAPEGWIDTLRAQGFRIAISPLHDKDVWLHPSPEKVDPETGDLIPKGALYKEGDLKKAHWHVIIVTDKRCSYVEMNNLLRNLLHCPYIQKCRSLRNSYDYFLHINHPEKCQTYKKEDIQTFNNFHVEPNKYEINLISMEIIRIIQEKNFTCWASVVEYFADCPEMSLILSSRTAYFNSYVKSRFYRDNPVNVKYTEVKNVSRFSYEDDINK